MYSKYCELTAGLCGIFTCMIPSGILHGIRKVTVRTVVDNQNTYFRFKHFSEITYCT